MRGLLAQKGEDRRRGQIHDLVVEKKRPLYPAERRGDRESREGNPLESPIGDDQQPVLPERPSDRPQHRAAELRKGAIESGGLRPLRDLGEGIDDRVSEPLDLFFGPGAPGSRPSRGG